MITTATCPVCQKVITADKLMLNQAVRDHHSQEHSTTSKLIDDNIMEIGRLKDQIARKVKEVKRLTGYKIPYTKDV